MYIVALTGGIGCGKSTVTQCFANLDVPVIDADEIARQLTAAGQPLLNKIRKTFGDNVFTADDQLDRSALRKIIFNNPVDKSRLENILHPAIHREMLRQINETMGDYVILSIPLLAETVQQYPYDRVLVIDCPEALQISRVIKRDNITTEQAHSIIRQQAGREQRLALADDIIENSGTLDDLAKRVSVLHRQYLELAINKQQGATKA